MCLISLELLKKIQKIYKSCLLKKSHSLNVYQFEKFIEQLYQEYQQKGILREEFDLMVQLALLEMGIKYVNKSSEVNI